MMTVPMKGEIAAWALPKENIPFRLTWNEPIEFDRIDITVPHDLRIVELLNVGKHRIAAERAVIYEVKSVSDAPMYFGGVVQVKRIPRKLATQRKINLRFSFKSKVIREVSLEARIFRPLVKVLDAPKSITLTAGEKHEIPMSMRYTGFGDVKISVQGIINGQLVTKGQYFVYEIMERIVKLGIEMDMKRHKELKRRIRVTPAFVRGVTQQIINMINQRTGETKFNEMVDEMRELLKTVSYERTLSEALNSRVEDVILGMVLDLKSRNPTGNVRLASGETSVEAAFATSAENLTIRVRYE